VVGVTLFVGNLPREVGEVRLRTLLGGVADIRSVSIPLDRLTGRPRGFALVEVTSHMEAREIVRQFNGYLLDTRRLRVEPVREPQGGYAPNYRGRPRIRGRPAPRQRRPERSPGR